MDSLIIVLDYADSYCTLVLEEIPNKLIISATVCVKNMGGITLSGDGHHDSMGHCAKYCAYTIFCCTLPRIIHFALVQVG